MVHTPLDSIPLWAVFGLTIVGILLSVELGYRTGLWRRRASAQEKEAPVGAMVAAQLGLLAFLLAFTFGFAASRYADRREVLLDESNAIGTAFLRTAMIPDPHPTEIRRLLREYVAVRIAAVEHGFIDEAIRQSEELHVRLWSETVAAANKDPRSIPLGLFIQALNDVINLHAKRLQVSLRTRVPGTLWGVLAAVTALSFFAMGYLGGLAGTSRSPAVLVIALTFAATTWMIADLDRPSDGLLKVSQRPMIELQQSMAESKR